MSGQLEELRGQVDEKRAVVDENRNALNALRTSYQQVQRSQFDAEKKVAVADTSIQNLQRTIFHLEEEKATRTGSDLSAGKRPGRKSSGTLLRQQDLEELQAHHTVPRSRSWKHRAYWKHFVPAWQKRTENSMQKRMSMTC
jgi:chromosome segregation protein